MKAYDLKDLESGELATLAKEAGYSSLRSCLNSNSWWAEEVSTIANMLRKEIETPAE